MECGNPETPVVWVIGLSHLLPGALMEYAAILLLLKKRRKPLRTIDQGLRHLFTASNGAAAVPLADTTTREVWRSPSFIYFVCFLLSCIILSLLIRLTLTSQLIFNLLFSLYKKKKFKTISRSFQKFWYLFDTLIPRHFLRLSVYLYLIFPIFDPSRSEHVSCQLSVFYPPQTETDRITVTTRTTRLPGSSPVNGSSVSRNRTLSPMGSN